MIYIKKIFSVLICTFITLYSSTPTLADNDSLMPIIEACVDLGDFDRDTTGIDDLVLRVLYTHDNFVEISGKAPAVTTADNLKMCDAAYIQQLVHDVFRLTAPTPDPSRLTELKYCYNDRRYTYYGEYDGYFNSKINEITNTVSLDNGDLLVVFSNTRTNSDGESVTRYNTAIFGEDEAGVFLRSLDLDADLSDISAVIDSHLSKWKILAENIKRFLPLVICVIALALVIFVLFRYVLF